MLGIKASREVDDSFEGLWWKVKECLRVSETNVKEFWGESMEGAGVYGTAKGIQLHSLFQISQNLSRYLSWTLIYSGTPPNDYPAKTTTSLLRPLQKVPNDLP